MDLYCDKCLGTRQLFTTPSLPSTKILDSETPTGGIVNEICFVKGETTGGGTQDLSLEERGWGTRSGGGSTTANYGSPIKIA